MEFVQQVALIVCPHPSDWRLAAWGTSRGAAPAHGAATIDPAGGRCYLAHGDSDRAVPVDYVGGGHGRAVTLSSSAKGARPQPMTAISSIDETSGRLFRTPLLGKSGALTSDLLLGPAVLLVTPGSLSLVIFGATLATFASKADAFTALSTAHAVAFQPGPRKSPKGGSSIAHELQIMKLAKAA